jgi:predicted metalloprotease with PDZ domain
VTRNFLIPGGETDLSASDQTYPSIIPRIRRSRGTSWRLFFLVLLASVCGTAQAAEPIRYVVDLRAPDSHLVQVTMNVPGATPGAEIQFPAWNCLYQIRDFVRNVQDLEAECDGQHVELGRVDLNTWRGPSQSCGNLEFRYAVYAREDGPFSSMLDSEHAFLNFAMLLFYLPKDRDRAAQVKMLLPEGWKLATLLHDEGDEFQAENYDALVDSPVEAGHFAEYTYTQEFHFPNGVPDSAGERATFRVIVHADPEDYSADRLLGSIQKITATETALMQDLPFGRYTFILHFPRETAPGGGMEHRNGTAITVPASVARSRQAYLEDVIAHEFFHAWNVKRFRPQSLEPIDYIHGNDTRDLWFCEGVTSTYAELTLLRAGLINRDTFYSRLAGAIQALQGRTARRFQSVETSGREAWLEKYTDYHRPERSISYYNKGELVGFLLDLGIRNASHNQASLDDVMRRLNQDFAQQGRFYTLADIRAIVSRLAPSFGVDRFLADYVQGTQELDYATYLGYAGVRLATKITQLAAPGFAVSRAPTGLMQVESVEPGSDAQRAGLQPGDILLEADGEPLAAAAEATLPRWQPGQAVELQIAREGRTRVLKFRIGVNHQISYRVEEDPKAEPGQLRVREGWLKGETTSPTLPRTP